MENENVEDSNDDIIIRPQGVSFEFATFLTLIVLATSGIGGYFFGSRSPADTPEHKAACVQSEALNKAQTEAQKIQFDYQIGQQKIIATLQQKAMEACLSRNGTPQLVGGNVACQK